MVDNDAVPALGTELTLQEAEEIDTNLKPGDIHEEKIESESFGRIGAQAAKQIIFQKVREAERMRIVDSYRDRVGELISGTVKKVTRDNVIVDLGGNAEALLPREHLIPRETFRMGDRVRALLLEIRTDHRGLQLILSHADSQMLIELFRIEVPEIAEGLVEFAVPLAIRARGQDSGEDQRRRIDPVDACVGMRGSHAGSV